MPASIKRIGTEPILLLTYEGYVTVEDQQMAFEESLKLMQGYSGLFYRVVDCRTAYTNLTQIMKMIRNASQGKVGTTTDARVQVVMVGSGHLETLFIEAMKDVQFGAVELPFFHELDDALVYVRKQIVDPE